MNNNVMVIKELFPNFASIKDRITNFLGYKKVNNFTVSLRNFLLYLLAEKNLLQLDLNSDYSKKEKNEFIYNCAINTINEFYYSEKYYKSPEIMSKRLMDMFDTNFKLRDFSKSDVDSSISPEAKQMITLFKELKKDLTSDEKKDLKIKARKIIASVD